MNSQTLERAEPSSPATWRFAAPFGVVAITILVLEGSLEVSDGGLSWLTPVEAMLSATLAWTTWSIVAGSRAGRSALAALLGAVLIGALLFDGAAADRVLSAPWIWVAATGFAIGVMTSFTRQGRKHEQ